MYFGDFSHHSLTLLESNPIGSGMEGKKVSLNGTYDCSTYLWCVWFVESLYASLGDAMVSKASPRRRLGDA